METTCCVHSRTLWDSKERRARPVRCNSWKSPAERFLLLHSPKKQTVLFFFTKKERKTENEAAGYDHGCQMTADHFPILRKRIQMTSTSGFAANNWTPLWPYKNISCAKHMISFRKRHVWSGFIAEGQRGQQKRPQAPCLRIFFERQTKSD